LDTFWADKQAIFDPLRSTGLYAKAGKIIEITVAKELIGKIMVITFKMKLVCNVLDQGFSTWGTRTPGGTREARGGTQNVKFTDNIWLRGTQIPKG
jgi:hypothetical protein